MNNPNFLSKAWEFIKGNALYILGALLGIAYFRQKHLQNQIKQVYFEAEREKLERVQKDAKEEMQKAGEAASNTSADYDAARTENRDLLRKIGIGFDSNDPDAK